MILVTGASGHYGGQAIAHLLRKGIPPTQIAALVRDAAKGQTLQAQGIELRVGDYTSTASIVQALEGIDKLLLVSSNDRGAAENRAIQHKNVIEAARQVGIKHLVYTSFVMKQPYAHSAIADFLAAHATTERALETSGIPFTILRNGIYLEMIPIFAGQQVTETGRLVFPAQTGRGSWVLRAELAEAAAQVLTTDGHQYQCYDLTNTEATSFFDVARDLSTVLSRDVHYESPSVAEFIETMQQAKVPDVYIGLFTTWASALSEGMLDTQSTSLATLLGRQPTTTAQFIAQTYTN